MWWNRLVVVIWCVTNNIICFIYLCWFQTLDWNVFFSALFIFILCTLSEMRDITSKGPVYGASSGALTWSDLKITCVHVFKSFSMYILIFMWWAVGDGFNPCINSLCFSRKNWGLVEQLLFTKNSPGIRKPIPYTSSAGVDWMSSLKLILKPRSIVDRISIHGFGEHISAAFNVRWSLSMIPFDWGW